MATSAIALAIPKQRAACTAMLGAAYASGDMAAIGVCMALAAVLRSIAGANYGLADYLAVAPAPLLFVAAYGVAGLYPGIMRNAVLELRRLTMTTTSVYLLLGAVLFFTRQGQGYSRSVFVLSWLLALVMVPLGRATLRAALGSKSWWGAPAVIFGSGDVAADVYRRMSADPGLGLRPVAVFSDGDEDAVVDVPVPVFYDMRWSPLYASLLDVKRVVLATRGPASAEVLKFLETHAHNFTHVYVMPDLEGLASFGVDLGDVGGMMTLELRRDLVRPGCQAGKRALDCVLGALIGLAVAPLIALIALAVCLDSRGAAFYGHMRIGCRGNRFKMWKFRTMYSNSAGLLKAHLEAHPEARAEWEANQKLQDDPRVTRIGRFLRAYSLDELPQIWNIIRGQMSLVGPRPIVDDEVERYGEMYPLYRRVTPGLTGLWQVSGRSLTTYARRVELDSYYVRNWSPWFDLYLLARTFSVVVKRTGAY
jgi:Undecaprenyl-phosphate galactose phosphotransferase WbaP